MSHLLSDQTAAPGAAVWPAVWPAVLAALAAIALLTAFHQVVQGAVDQAALRRQSAALYAQADWRCRVTPAQVRRAGLAGAGPVVDVQDACRQPR